MTPEDKRYDCCHEAGHAVAGVINGDQIVLVIGYPKAEMTEDQKVALEKLAPGPDVRASTSSKRGQPNCSCGGRVECVLVSLFKRRFYPGDPSCRVCFEFVANEVAVVMAGAEATSSLMPQLHNRFRSHEDDNDVNNYLRELAPERQADVWPISRRRAKEWMKDETRAVLALTDALEERGFLEGSEAERIVKENLGHTGGP